MKTLKSKDGDIFIIPDNSYFLEIDRERDNEGFPTGGIYPSVRLIDEAEAVESIKRGNLDYYISNFIPRYCFTWDENWGKKIKKSGIKHLLEYLVKK